jgi:hypothetical protein
MECSCEGFRSANNMQRILYGIWHLYSTIESAFLKFTFHYSHCQDDPCLEAIDCVILDEVHGKLPYYFLAS